MPHVSSKKGRRGGQIPGTGEPIEKDAEEEASNKAGKPRRDVPDSGVGATGVVAAGAAGDRGGDGSGADLDSQSEPLLDDAEGDEDELSVQQEASGTASSQPTSGSKDAPKSDGQPSQKPQRQGRRNGKKQDSPPEATDNGGFGEHARNAGASASAGSSNTCQSVAMQAAVNAVNCSNDYRPRNNISPTQVVRLRRLSYGGGPAAWLAYEKLLRVCEPHHTWRWKPDKSISDFWTALPAEVQADVTEVRSQAFRNLIKEHITMRTCYIKDLMAVSNEVYMLDDTHSIAVFQEFFRIAVSENACIAVNWQTVQAIDSTIQDFIKARMLSGELQDRVDPRDFPKGSSLWCQHREREHTRLALMCLTLEIFERRLLTMWEWQHGTARTQAVRRAAQARKAAEESGLDVLPPLGRGAGSATKAKTPKGNSAKPKPDSKADQAAWKAAEDAAMELILQEEQEEKKKNKGRGGAGAGSVPAVGSGAGQKKKKPKKPQAESGTQPVGAGDAAPSPSAPPAAATPAPVAPGRKRRSGRRQGASGGGDVEAEADASESALKAEVDEDERLDGEELVDEEEDDDEYEEEVCERRAACSGGGRRGAGRGGSRSGRGATSGGTDTAPSASKGRPPARGGGSARGDDGEGGCSGSSGIDVDDVTHAAPAAPQADVDIEEEIQAAQARVDAEDGDEIDAEFNRLVLEHLKARSVAAQDEVVDAYRSATVIKNLCQKLEVGLQTAIMGRGGP